MTSASRHQGLPNFAAMCWDLAARSSGAVPLGAVPGDRRVIVEPVTCGFVVRVGPEITP
jgi:hypothetical protein